MAYGHGLLMNDQPLILTVLPETLAVCRLPADTAIPAWATAESFFSITRTADELSVICRDALVPAGVAAARGWRALKLHGPFDFEQVGILLRVAEPLAAAGISILPIATYETDYVLVQAESLAAAVTILREAGHTIMNENL
jgi:uncharacterized protein